VHILSEYHAWHNARAATDAAIEACA
jgi:hypothetical protein